MHRTTLVCGTALCSTRAALRPSGTAYRPRASYWSGRTVISLLWLRWLPVWPRSCTPTSLAALYPGRPHDLRRTAARGVAADGGPGVGGEVPGRAVAQDAVA